MKGDPEQLSNGLLALLAYLTSINLLLLLLQPDPGLPARRRPRSRARSLGRCTGDRTRATNFAAALGQGFSYILIGLGLGLLGATVPVLGSDFVRRGVVDLHRHVPGPGRQGRDYQTALLSKIEGVRVADVMDAEPVAIPAT